DEARGEIAIGPAAGVFKRLREIPVVQRADGTDLCFEQSVGDTLIVIEALLIRGAGAIGLNPRPADREAAALQIELTHDGDILVVAMIGITGDVAGGSTFYFADSV